MFILVFVAFLLCIVYIEYFKIMHLHMLIRRFLAMKNNTMIVSLYGIFKKKKKKEQPINEQHI